MSSVDARTLPIDSESAAALEKSKLRMTLVDTADAAAFDEWLSVEARGFHEAAAEVPQLASLREALAYRRTTAVVDPESSRPTYPVGTVSSWVADLTVSPSRIIDAWAISSVTVSPTHTGRGVARAMLEGELRTAAAAGIPMAALTVSEATLYRRYGFAPAAMTGDWRFRTARVTWSGPQPTGTVELIGPREWRDDIDDLYARVRAQNAGHIDVWGRRWDEKAGIAEGSSEGARALRAARYLDEAGRIRGLLLYRLVPSDEFTDHRLVVEHLTTETDDASSALWRLALTMPLVSTVDAPMRRLDEPVRWQITDWRAATLSPRDNLWLRILDVPAALTARGWDSPGSVVLRVSDPLGFAGGTYRLEVDASGTATVADAGEDGVPEDSVGDVLELGIAELSSIYLGAVSVDTLARAGRIAGDASAIRRADALFRAAAEPWLPFWF